jgi:glycosyltransferase involved in cell wall biosynthesis
MPRFFIIDPQVKDYQGHHFECSQTTAEALQRLGFQPIVLAHKDFQITETRGVQYRPWFRFRQNTGQPNSWRLDLMRALKEEKIGADDHILVHTTHFYELEQLQAMMELTPPEVMPNWHMQLVYYYEEFYSYDRFSISHFFRRLNHQPTFAARANFYVDSALLREYLLPYAALANKDIHVLPAPLRHTLPVVERKHGPDDPLRIVFLGEARKEKGYAHLSQAVDYVLKHLPPGRKVEFIIQSAFNVPGGEPGMMEARTALQSMPQVKCLPEACSTEEFKDLVQSSDIILLPHDPRPFRRRSSGTITDAVGAGKVSVVPERCWLTTQVDETRAVTFEAYSQLGPAICRAITNFESLRAKAMAYAPTYQKENGPDALAARLIQPKPEWKPRPVSDPARKKALVICDDWVIAPFHGASQVGMQHLRYLREQEYEVHVLMRLPIASNQIPHIDFDLRLNCEEVCRQQGVERLWYAWFPSNLIAGWDEKGDKAAALATFERYADSDLRSDFLIRENYVVDPALVELAQKSPFECILLNYAHNMPLLEKLNLKDPPVICETHDYMARNKAEKCDGNIDPEEDQLEMSALAHCKGIITISEEEQKLFTKKLPPHMKSAHLVPALAVKRDPVVATAGCMHVLDVAQAAGIMDISNIQLLVKFLEKQQSIQLLFVSSTHQQAVQSFIAFYTNVFVPFLKARGVVVTVVGSMGPPNGFPKNEFQVQFLGRMKDLSPLYAASQVVILPIYFGTGTGIKTIEAIGYGRPILGTPLAFRGFTPEIYKEAAPLIVANPQDFAAKALELLADVEKRKANAQHVHNLARHLPRWSDYSNGLSKLAAESLPGLQPMLLPPDPPPDPEPYFEFGGDALGFNIMLRLVLMGGQPAPGDSTRMLEAMKNPSRRALFEKIFDSFFVSRTAPMAQGFNKSGFFLDAVRWGGRSFEDLVTFLENAARKAA